MVYQAPTPDCIPRYDLTYGEEWNPPEDIRPKSRKESAVGHQDGAVRIVRRTPVKPVKVTVGKSLLKR